MNAKYSQQGGLKLPLKGLALRTFQIGVDVRRRQRKASVAPPTDLGMNGQGSACNARQCPSRQQPLQGRSHSIGKLITLGLAGP